MGHHIIHRAAVAGEVFDLGSTTQASYRWRNDDGSETAATWAAAADTSLGAMKTDTDYRLRFLIQDSSDPVSAFTGTLEANVNSTGWFDVTTTSESVQAIDSTNLTDGADTTQQLGGGTFVSNNNGVSEDGTGGAVDFSGSDEAEFEYAIRLQVGDLLDQDGNTVQFRIKEATHSVTASATIDLVDPTTILGDLSAWWDFGDTASIWQDTGATTPADAQDDPVARVDDKSGNGYHLEQSTSAKQMAFDTTAVNGEPGITHVDSTEYYDVASGPAISEPFTVVAVIKDNGARGAIFDNTNRSSYTLVNAKSNATLEVGSVRVFNGLADAASGNPDSTSWILEIVTDGTGGDEVIANNGTPSSITVGTNGLDSGEVIRVGADISLSSSFNWEGSIGEVILINDVLTSTERTDLYQYLNDRWGL